MKVLICTDAWYPQVNGVCRTLKNLGDELKKIGHDVEYIEPNLFLNDFLEMLYYIKNISHIENEGNNFTLNDNDHKKITSLSKAIEPNDILLFWEFTLKTLKEINLVANPNLLIEMFLIQLTYLKKMVPK